MTDNGDVNVKKPEIKIFLVQDSGGKKWSITQIGIDAYKKKSGVWLLIGKEKGEKEKTYSLQVGQSADIGKEIKANIFRLNYGLNHNIPEMIEKNYVNQFGELKFKYSVYPDERQFLYSEIAKKYTEFKLVVFEISAEIEKEERKKIEKYVAYKTKSLYWRNGGAYKEGKTENKISDIKKFCDEEATDIKSENIIPDFVKHFLDALANENMELNDVPNASKP